ncbi:MAG: DUF3795 domain-containing protein [Thermoplasmata archaeon]|nr:DUF3795 domain-containing protein [Thermoplasmata archaeon]
MAEQYKMIGACGLICDGCDIMEATNNPETARKIVDWFKQELKKDVKPEEIYCSGCKGDRSRHWSDDCWILQCCVDDKGLEFCYECEDFPCEKLSEWAEQNERYTEAHERLKEMKAGLSTSPSDR